jgi:plasmid stabilization system protein ParE
VIVYDHVGDTVIVLRVLHGRRNITRKLVRETER